MQREPEGAGEGGGGARPGRRARGDSRLAHDPSTPSRQVTRDPPCTARHLGPRANGDSRNRKGPATPPGFEALKCRQRKLHLRISERARVSARNHRQPTVWWLWARLRAAGSGAIRKKRLEGISRRIGYRPLTDHQTYRRISTGSQRRQIHLDTVASFAPFSSRRPLSARENWLDLRSRNAKRHVNFFALANPAGQITHDKSFSAK